MLNKGDAQDFYDRREVAQRLSQSETISVGDVLLEYLLDQAKLGRQSHKHLRLVKALFNVLGQQLFVLGEDFVEKVNHEEQNFKSDVLSVFVLRNEVWVIWSASNIFKSIFLNFIIDWKDKEYFVKDLGVMDQELYWVICHKASQFGKHLVRSLQSHLLGIFHA